MKYLSGTIFFLMSILILSHFTQCANIVPPSGGPVDSIPPRILSISPADSSLNIKPQKIEITFDKFMELGDWNQVMTMSPLIDIQPQVTANMRKVVITIPDTLLRENTTYTLSLGNTLKDNREGTPYNDFNYTFSTGAYLDSLALQARVLSADRLAADTQYLAALYLNEAFTDSTIFQKKPMYLSAVKPDGFFEFRHLPLKEFRMFVFHDKDNDRKYNPVIDGIAYTDSVFMPRMDFDTLTTLYLSYKELDSVEQVMLSEMSSSMVLEGDGRGAARKSTSAVIIPKEGFIPLVDTSQVDRGTQELNRPLEIHINHNLVKDVDMEKIFLSFEKEGVEIQAITDIKVKDSIIFLQTDWQEDSEYILRLIKGWATDTAAQDLMPGRYRFRSKKEDDYTRLSVKVDTAYVDNDHWVMIYNEKDSIASRRIEDTVLVFSQLQPLRADFELYIFKDINQDGKWTPGDYMKGIQPEPVYKHREGLKLRAGWTHEETFSPMSSIFLSPRKPVKNEEEEDGGEMQENEQKDNEKD